MKAFLYASAATCALAFASPGFAQTAAPATAPQPAAQPTATDNSGISEVVVTAQRRTESAQHAAIAIDVVGAAQLTNAGVITPTTLNAAVPSLYVARAGGANTSFFIRGVGNFTNNGYSDPAVAFNVDGVYYGRPTSTTGTFYDLDRVEVLKGPQGTLYGRNATGGAINVIPVKPKLDQTSGYASIGYGNFNTVDAEGAINLPIGDHAAFRASGKIVDSDGYYDDGTGDEVGQAFRLQLLDEVTNNLTVRISADYSHTGGEGSGFSFNGYEQYTPGSPATASSPANYTFMPSGLGPYSGLQSSAGKAYFASLYLGGPGINPGPLDKPYQDNDYAGGNIEINWKTAFGTLTVIPAYRDSKVNDLFNGPAFRAGLNKEHDKQATIEARFAGNRIGIFDWLVGGFYYNEKIHGQYTFNQYTIQSYQLFDTSTDSAAVFGRVTANITDRFRLVGGLRYTQDRKQFDGTAQTLVEICTLPGPPTGTGCIGGPSVPTATSLANLASVIPASQIPAGLPPAPGPANARPFGSSGNLLFYSPVSVHTPLNTDRLTYRAAAEFDLTPRSLLYASYETGYRSGGFALALGHATYAPEYIEAATIGIKNRLFDNRVQLNVEAFHWKYRDQQVSHFGLDTNGNSAFFTENIGQSTIQGVDVDGQFKATPTTLLRASVQYLDNTLDSFIYDTPRGGTSLAPVVGCPYTNGTDSSGRSVYVVNCSGFPGYNSPKWTSNIGIDQTFDVGHYNLVLTVDGRYRDNRVIGFDFLQQENSGSQFTVDASLALSPMVGKWTLTAWVRNLTNEAVPVLTQYAGTTGNSITTNYMPPRAFGVRARLDF